ncbi:unnamed protein product [Strongylus vulgaris]|uniref:EndoU domain-containing protein n=1 Tax=Strongylus vulgaris TaxID=40348 RepID=A0A3P7L9N7_STRVU|nr:unnamed protein product [Strongylus vulgaris]
MFDLMQIQLSTTRFLSYYCFQTFAVKCNFQNMASHKDFTHDNAPKPLYTSVVESALSSATYKALDNLIAFYNQPDVDTAETMTPAWEASISSFLDAVTNTTVMQSAHTFLVDLGLTSPNETLFKNQLYSLWFTFYARDTVTGSSEVTVVAGFEALFGGEVKESNVIRFGNWLRFYQQEKAGNLNYHGWFQREVVGFSIS